MKYNNMKYYYTVYPNEDYPSRKNVYVYKVELSEGDIISVMDFEIPTTFVTEDEILIRLQGEEEGVSPEQVDEVQLVLL